MAEVEDLESAWEQHSGEQGLIHLVGTDQKVRLGKDALTFQGDVIVNGRVENRFSLLPAATS